MAGGGHAGYWYECDYCKKRHWRGSDYEYQRNNPFYVRFCSKECGRQWNSLANIRRSVRCKCCGHKVERLDNNGNCLACFLETGSKQFPNVTTWSRQ